jgi:hypothetical protein
MSSLAPLRADLLAGDYRCLYLGWLDGVGCHELDDDAIEPPGRYRRLMKQRLNKDYCQYGQRRQSETTIAMIKARQGDSLAARTHPNRTREIRLMSLTHNVLILYVTCGLLQSNSPNNLTYTPRPFTGARIEMPRRTPLLSVAVSVLPRRPGGRLGARRQSVSGRICRSWHVLARWTRRRPRAASLWGCATWREETSEGNSCHPLTL